MLRSRSDAAELAAQMLAWVDEADSVQGLREKGLPPNVVELVRLKHGLSQEIATLEDKENQLWKRLVEAVEAL